MKCDEEKPVCCACRSTGRLCDGYSTQKSQDIPSLLYGKVYGVSSAALANLHLCFLKSGEERRHFEYFQCKTRKQIEHAFGSATRVHQLILQGSHSDTSLKHMVIALGSLTEHLDQVKFSSDESVRKGQYLGYADTQYIKGISQLRQDMSCVNVQSAELILTSCLLLSLFDFLRGKDTDGRVHLAAGIDILRRCFSSQFSTLMHRRITDDFRPSVLSEDFAVVFSAMDLHAAIWVGRPVFHSSPMIEMISDRSTLDCDLRPELNLDDISNNLDFQIMRAHRFHHSNAPVCRSLVEAPTHIYTERERLLYELRQWLNGLEYFLSTSPQLTQDDEYRITLMRMNYHSLVITISHFFQPHHGPPQSDSTLTYHLSQIITESRSILCPDINDPSRFRLLRAIAANCQEPDPANLPIFAFVPGAIQPLYLTALHSVNAQMREEAITLLEENPWREGAWDSAVMAALARRGGSQ